MKKLFIVLALALASKLYGQANEARLAYCLNGSTWIPLLAAAGGQTVTPTPVGINLFGNNGGTATAMTCDSSGNLAVSLKGTVTNVPTADAQGFTVAGFGSFSGDSAQWYLNGAANYVFFQVNGPIGLQINTSKELYVDGGASGFGVQIGTLQSGEANQLGSSSSTNTLAGINHINVASFASQAGIATAATIAPTAQFFHITNATTQITTITAPSFCTTASTMCQLSIIPDAAFTTGTSGNIALASTAVINKVLIMTFDPTTSKWYPSY